MLELRSLVHQETEETTSLSVCDSLLHTTDTQPSLTLEIKEEPEEQLVDDGQTQEVILPFPESVKEERDQPVTPDYNEQLLSTSDFSVAESDNYGSDEARLQKKEFQKNTRTQKWKAPQRLKEKENVQAALPDRESSARSPRDSRTCPVCGRGFRYMFHLTEHMKVHKSTSEKSEDTDTGSSHGNQSSFGFSLEIKEEPEEQLVDDGQTQEVFLPFPEPVKEERDQLVTASESEKEKENVQAALPDRESSAGSFGDSRNCPVCGRGFRYMFHLTEHMKFHKRTSVSEKKLLSHLEETQNENLVCKVCSKRFANRRNLQMHSKLHTGIKDLESQDRGKTFSQTDSLIEHRGTHTGERPYHCDISGKAFTQRSTLDAHTRAQTATLPLLTNSAAALAGEETSTQPSIKEEFNHDPSEPPGLSHTIMNTENSHGNQSSLGFSLGIKEEPEEQLVDDGQTQEVVLPFPESVKEERDQPVTPDYNEQLLFTSDFSVAESDKYGSDEARLQKNTRTQKWKAPQRQKEKENVQAALPDRDSSARSPRDSRTCPVCGRGFRYMFHLIEHIKFHKRTSESEKKLLSHLEGTQTENLVCKVCSKRFANRRNLQMHSKLHTGIKDLESQDCGKTLSKTDSHNPSEPPGLSHSIMNTENSHGNQSSLGFSLEIKEEPEEQLVDDGQTQEVVLPFPEPVKEERDQLVTASESEKENVQAALPDRESSARSQIDSRTCPVCGRGFRYTFHLREHMKSHKRTSEEEQLVDDGQTQEVVLPFPESVKEERDQPVTPNYNKQWHFSSDLSASESDNYGSDEEWVESKELQTNTWRWKASENVQAALPDRESSARSQIDSRTCTVCGRAFRYMFDLRQHMAFHESTSKSKKKLLSHPEGTQNENLVCTVCGKRFSNPSALETHSKIHTGIKAFECQDCGKKFSRKGNLIKHTRTHTGEKPYHCDICGETFIQISALNKHTKTHTATLPLLTNSAAALAGEETSTQPSIKEEFNHDPSEPPGLSHSIINTENSHGNQSSLGFSLEVKEEPEEQLVDDGHSNTWRWKSSAPQKKSEKENVQAALPDRESSARSFRDSRTCTVCGRGFRYTFDLRQHMKSHESTGKSKKKLLSHLEGTQNENLVCKVCGKRFANRSTLWVHSKMHTGIKDYECQDCGKKFSQKASLIKHTRTHTGEKPYHCDICGKTFSQISALNKHTKTHTATLPSLTNSAAALAGEETSTQPSIKEEFNHDPSEPPGLSHSILNTENSHGNQSLLGFSLEIKEEPEEQLVDDGHSNTWSWKSTAPQKQSEKENVQAALPNRESSARSFRDSRTCTVCGRGFRYMFDLRQHMKSHESTSKSKKKLLSHPEGTQNENLVCKVCGKRFSSKGSLQTHSKIHTGIKDYECQDCGKTFVQKVELIIHTRTHTGEKPYHCDICGEAFSLSHHLNYHMRTHTGEKPYHCDICGEAFSRRDTLNVHMRTHTGEKPYHCDICGKAFSQSSNLYTHMRKHTGEKP